MAEVVYALCGLMSLACAVLLWRGYRRTRARLLLWSSLCFIGLTGNNLLLFIDKVVLPDINFSDPRGYLALGSLLLLLYGMIWDAE